MTIKDFVLLILQDKRHCFIKRRLGRLGNTATAEDWANLSQEPVGAESILELSKFMAGRIAHWMQTVEDDRKSQNGYSAVLSEGHSFLREICKKAGELGVYLPESETTALLTVREVMMAADSYYCPK